MTKIKEILDEFNIEPSDRYGEGIENINVGNYTFDNFEEYDYIKEFTSNTYPEIVLRINDEIMNVVLLKILNEKEVEATSWTGGKKFTKIFSKEQMGL